MAETFYKHCVDFLRYRFNWIFFLSTHFKVLMFALLYVEFQ